MAWTNTPVANNGSKDYKYGFTNFSSTTTNDTVKTYVGSDQNTTLPNLFEHTKDFKDVTSYNLMRGVPDFGSLVQFNPYETGYAAFIVCKIPKFIEMLASKNTKYEQLVNNFVHIIESEFKSFDGLQDINADTIQLGDDLNSINVISKVNMQSASEFSLSYDEKSGSPLTKFAKLYLTGIKDPYSKAKTYHGLVEQNLCEPGLENEVFTLLYYVTDNTMRRLEKAYLLCNAQLTKAKTSIYDSERGQMGNKDLSVEFNCFPITGYEVDKAAAKLLSDIVGTEYQTTNGVQSFVKHDIKSDIPAALDSAAYKFGVMDETYPQGAYIPNVFD